MLKTLIYPQSEFPDVYRWQVIAFMRTQWPSIFQGDLRFMAQTYPPDLHPIHFVVAEAETLISYAAVLRLPVTHAGRAYDVMGFGNMFTFPPYRGEGHGWRVLRAATDFIQGSTADVGALFCEPALESFYAAAGWSVAPSPTRVAGPGNDNSSALRMMLYISEQGRQARADFEDLPLHVDWIW